MANFVRTTSRFAAVYASPRIECVRRAVHLTFAMGRLHTSVVTLRRESRDINWGLRIVGGADLATPLIVTRVPTRPSQPRPRSLGAARRPAPGTRATTTRRVPMPV